MRNSSNNPQVNLYLLFSLAKFWTKKLYKQLLSGLTETLLSFLRTFSWPLSEKSLFLSFFAENNLSILLSLCNDPIALKPIIPLVLGCLEYVYSNISKDPSNSPSKEATKEATKDFSKEIRKEPPKEMEIPLNFAFFCKGVLNCLQLFKEALEANENTYTNSQKISLEQFGFKRINIILVIKEMFKRNDTEINREFVTSGILKDAFGLIFRFQWNNVLHCAVDEMFAQAVKTKNLIVLEQVTTCLF